MPSNSHSGERQIGNTVNYFSLTFSSQDKLLVIKGKHYALMMILRERKCEQISQIFSGSEVLYRVFFSDSKHLNQSKMSCLIILGKGKITQWKYLLIFLTSPLRILADTIYLTKCLHYTEYQVLNVLLKYTSIHAK